MTSRVLQVPYLAQPTGITCQSTCLKMFGLYLAARGQVSHPVADQDIGDIWKEINTGNDRPSKDRNSYTNMVWWLGKNFPRHRFSVRSTRDTDEALGYVVDRINAGFPLMVSTNHSNTDGHIILVIGYSGATPGQCSRIQMTCHDPYGRFNPALKSKLYAKRRYDGGASLADGGEVGPGKAVTYDHNGIRRIRSDKHSNGTYFMISATGANP
jgi:hypothetical protein